jgi:hypothetical protein
MVALNACRKYKHDVHWQELDHERKSVGEKEQGCPLGGARKRSARRKHLLCATPTFGVQSRSLAYASLTVGAWQSIIKDVSAILSQQKVAE